MRDLNWQSASTLARMIRSGDTTASTVMKAHCDALPVSSAPGEAPKGLGSTGDPLFSRMWTLLQLPAVTLPLGTGLKGLPLGVQLIGRRNGDERPLAVAQWIYGRFTAST